MCFLGLRFLHWRWWLGLCFLGLFFSGCKQDLPRRGPVLSFDVSGQSVECRVWPDTGCWELRWSEGMPWAGLVAGGMAGLERSSGTDVLGAFEEVRFEWLEDGNLSGSIRLYENKPLALFSQTWKDGLVEKPSVFFPSILEIPDLEVFTHQGLFAAPAWQYRPGSRPWLLAAPSGYRFLVSPANHFFTAFLSGLDAGRLESGLNPGVEEVPSGFTQKTLLVYGKSVNALWEDWGRALMALHGKRPLENDDHPMLATLGYFTDNGSAYYYSYDESLGYEGTLLALADHWWRKEVPVRYVQLDSWWYPKGPNDPEGRSYDIVRDALWKNPGGMLGYEADPDVFPEGLQGFQEKLALPLMVHTRWLGTDSPLRDLYEAEGPVLLGFEGWRDTMADLAEAGVLVFEQDWLDQTLLYPPMRNRLGLGETFLGNMARAAGVNGIQIQYCMPEPLHLLEGSRHSNVTTARVSADRFQVNRWESAIFTSRFSSALGIWPWVDVFKTDETGNFLLSILSGGMVAFGDALGEEDVENIARAARRDGVLVKPDTALVPSDWTYEQRWKNMDAPILAYSSSHDGAGRTAYVFGFNRSAHEAAIELSPSMLGMDGRCFALDYFGRQGAVFSDDAPKQLGFPAWKPVQALQAESGMLSGGLLVQKRKDAEKRRYIALSDEGDAKPGSCKWTLRVPRAGNYEIAMRVLVDSQAILRYPQGVRVRVGDEEPVSWHQWPCYDWTLRFLRPQISAPPLTFNLPEGELDIEVLVNMPSIRLDTLFLYPAQVAQTPFYWQYLVVSKIDPSGLACLGDLDHFAPMGRQRIEAVRHTESGFAADMLFAPGETQREISFFCSDAPEHLSVEVEKGNIETPLVATSPHVYRVGISPASQPEWDGRDLLAPQRVRVRIHHVSPVEKAP